LITPQPSTVASVFSNKSILLDTNILLLWLVGQFDTAVLERFKPTRRCAFSTDDYQLVDSAVQASRRIVLPTSVLTEASNLTGQATGTLRNKLR